MSAVASSAVASSAVALRADARTRGERSPVARWARAVLAALLLFVGALAGATPRADAQDLPADVQDVPEGQALTLPPAPDGYLRERRGPVEWEFPAQATDVALALQEVHRAEWPRLLAELGGTVSSELVIRIGRNPDEMRALAPREAPPPAYASGVAYPRRGLVLLTLTAPETWQRPDVASVFVHELSHIALHRAVAGQPVPRWFTEGVAIHQAGEQSMERVQVLWGGTVGERLLPLDRLSRGFPDHPHRVSLAYAQSADFVRWLLARDDGERKFRELIHRMARGQAFETAFHRTYSVRLARLEMDWHDSLAERFQALPLLIGSGTVWVLAAGLIVLAYRRRRRRDREKLAQWEAEERATLEAAAVWLGARPTAPGAPAAPSASGEDEEDSLLYVIPADPRGRDAGIPTVEHEGRNHTLH